MTAFGFVTVMRNIKQHAVRIGILFALAAAYMSMFSYFWHQYTVHYGTHHPWFRNFAHKELARAIQKDYQNARWIFVPQIYGGVEQMMRFYLGFQPQPKIMTAVGAGKYESFKNILFTPEICPYPKLIDNKIITDSELYVYVNAPECHTYLDDKDKIDRIITWNDGNTAFEILRGKDALRQ
jgi:hypothetical protein